MIEIRDFPEYVDYVLSVAVKSIIPEYRCGIERIGNWYMGIMGIGVMEYVISRSCGSERVWNFGAEVFRCGYSEICGAVSRFVTLSTAPFVYNDQSLLQSLYPLPFLLFSHILVFIGVQ